jgi:tRNA C32,U32 (ribose-2'-O)-methylase TrmJ
VLGNEGSGLNSTQIAICDHFVYIPQYTDKTASLNVAIAGSIIFHHWAMWAQYTEAPRTDQKYDVKYYQQGTMPRIIMPSAG